MTTTLCSIQCYEIFFLKGKPFATLSMMTTMLLLLVAMHE
jgi:hypothetical protein